MAQVAPAIGDMISGSDPSDRQVSKIRIFLLTNFKDP